ncbi:hypothetical protein [Nostoc sp.]
MAYHRLNGKSQNLEEAARAVLKDLGELKRPYINCGGGEAVGCDRARI